MIKTVTIVGANWTMGFNASAIFAAFGNAKVYMVSRDVQKSKNAIEKAIKSVRIYQKKRNSLWLFTILKESDLIFKSVSEKLELKKEITEMIGKLYREDAIIGTGTSDLSVNEIVEVLPQHLKSRYLGMHFFNPPYQLTLLELIKTKYSSKELIEMIGVYMSFTLLRTVIVAKDKPAFLANRIGFQFINLCSLVFQLRYN